MTGSILNVSLCPLPFACWVSPPPPLQAFNSLLPSISLPPHPPPFWAHPEKSKSPCPVETAYSRQGPKVPAESQPDARHKHSPERAQPGSPATWSGAQQLPATPGRVSRASRGHSATSLPSLLFLRSHRAHRPLPLATGKTRAPQERRGNLPPHPSHPVPSQASLQGSMACVAAPGHFPGSVPRGCAPVTPGESSGGRALLSSRRSPGCESEDAPGLRGVLEPKSPGQGDLSPRQRWLPGSPELPRAPTR